MTQVQTLQALDVRLATNLLAKGLADLADYTPVTGPAVLGVVVFLRSDTLDAELEGAPFERQTTITAFRSQVGEVKKDDRFFISPDTYIVDAITDDADESRIPCFVRKQ